MRRVNRTAALAAALFAAGALGCSPREPAMRNLLLVSLDTTRPDHLSAYGYHRPTSPRFDRLAESGALFHNAFAQWTATGPSHATMLTGLYPHTHGFGVIRPRLRKRFVSLATVLRTAGYRTGAFVSGFTLKGKLGKGLDRGFDVYDAAFKGVRRNGGLTIDAALGWLDAGTGPYFLFVHLFDAHGPYTERGEIPRLFESDDPGPELPHVPVAQRLTDAEGRTYNHLNDYVDHYDSGLVYQDRLLGRLIEAIDLDSTVVFVVADHGESMGEHGGRVSLTHATGVFDTQARIPFLIRAPRLEPARFDEIVETVDILPTALDLLEVPLPRGLEPQGESLGPLLRGERRERAGGLAFTGTWPKQRQEAVAGRIFGRGRPIPLDRQRIVFAARSSRWKLKVYPAVEGDLVRLYDFEIDPGETTDVGDQYPEIRARLLERSKAWITGAEEPIEEPELSPDDIEKLRALGYVD